MHSEARFMNLALFCAFTLFYFLFMSERPVVPLDSERQSVCTFCPSHVNIKTHRSFAVYRIESVSDRSACNEGEQRNLVPFFSFLFSFLCLLCPVSLFLFSLLNEMIHYSARRHKKKLMSVFIRMNLRQLFIDLRAN